MVSHLFEKWCHWSWLRGEFYAPETFHKIRIFGKGKKHTRAKFSTIPRLPETSFSQLQPPPSFIRAQALSREPFFRPTQSPMPHPK